MIQLLIQFQKYILSIYISFLSTSFPTESDSKVSMNSSRRYDSSHVFVTWFRSTQIHTLTHIRLSIRKRIVSIFHPCFLRRRSWGIWRIQPSAENGENEREGKKEEKDTERERKIEIEFFFFWSLASREREIEISRRWYYVTATVS